MGSQRAPGGRLPVPGGPPTPPPMRPGPKMGSPGPTCMPPPPCRGPGCIRPVSRRRGAGQVGDQNTGSNMSECAPGWYRLQTSMRPLQQQSSRPSPWHHMRDGCSRGCHPPQPASQSCLLQQEATQRKPCKQVPPGRPGWPPYPGGRTPGGTTSSMPMPAGMPGGRYPTPLTPAEARPGSTRRTCVAG
jgi:hypothetical protein